MRAAGPASRFPRHPAAILPPLFILLAVVLVASGTLDHAPVFDDHLLLAGNADLLQGSAFPIDPFTRRYWGVAPEAAANELYRPVTIASLVLEARAWDGSMRGMHAGNIAIHAFNSLMAWLLVRTLFRRDALAFVAAILFAVHPLATEVVAPLSGRADLLAGLFLLTGSWVGLLAARGTGPRSWWAGGACAVLCALGALSKEHVFTAPLVIALLIGIDPFRTGERAMWRRLAVPAGAAAGVALALIARIQVLGYLWRSPLPQDPEAAALAWVGNSLIDAGPVTRLLTVGRIFLTIVRLVLFPAVQSADYCHDQILPVVGPFEPAALLGTTLLAGCFVTCILSFRRYPIVAAALGWSALTWGLTSNILFPIGTIFAERLLYLPLLGCTLLISGLACRIARGSVRRGRWVAILVMVAVAAFGIRFHVRAADWADDGTLFAATAAASPRCARAHSNLGAVAQRAGRTEEAVRAYSRALSIAPGLTGTGIALTHLLVGSGDHDSAIGTARNTIDHAPGSVQARRAFAEALQAGGLTAEAENAWRDVIALQGAKDPNAFGQLALLIFLDGRDALLDPLLDPFSEPERRLLRPPIADAGFRAGLIALDRGETPRFVALMRKAVELDPGHAPAHFNLALQALRDQDIESARRHAAAARSAGYTLPPGFAESVGLVHAPPAGVSP